jgi:two-component system phosphate regulon sensor histidine kinase PhoR
MIRQYGVLAYDQGDDGGLRFLLITSRETKRWVIPRGNPIRGLSPSGAAAQEAWEEAGIRGAVEDRALGSYRYDKRRADGSYVPAEVEVFALAVGRLLDDWPEKGQRERRWFAPAEAAEAVEEPELKALVLGQAERLAERPDPGPLESATVQGLVESLPEPALIVRDGKVATANRAARQLLGERIAGQDVRLAIRHPAALERLLAPAPGPADEVELVGIGEPERRWMMAVAPLDGGALFVRLTDRSEAHAAERMRVDFVANASHELRTPLATLVGYAETLREQGGELDSETRERFTAIVHDEARRMQRLVEDLISLSRIEAERYSAPQESLALTPLIEAARDGCRGFAEERESEIRIAAEEDLPAVPGDRSQILQMIDNLIGNALRYGRRGTPVSISARREGGMVHLVVADEGEGIAAEHIPRLTERFYRADPSRSRALGGTGLGLAIVKHIVERHRGRLTIESEVGRGTMVHVLLPAAEPDPPS